MCSFQFSKAYSLSTSNFQQDIALDIDEIRKLYDKLLQFFPAYEQSKYPLQNRALCEKDSRQINCICVKNVEMPFEPQQKKPFLINRGYYNNLRKRSSNYIFPAKIISCRNSLSRWRCWCGNWQQRFKEREVLAGNS